jgi:hypothetical protein
MVLKRFLNRSETTPMSPGTAFHDTSSSSTPAYDFVARPKSVVPSGNPTFGGMPIAKETPTLAPGYVPDKAPGLSATQKILVAIPLALVLVALVAYVGSFTVRAIETHHRQSLVKATTIVLPKTIAGMTKEGASAQAQVDKVLGQIQTPTPPKGAAYKATKSQVALVIAGAYPMADKDQHDFVTAAAQTMRPLGVQLTPADTGTLGGHVQCGTVPRRDQTICVFTDVAAYGVVVVPGTGQTGLTTARAFRGAVEHRS